MCIRDRFRGVWAMPNIHDMGISMITFISTCFFIVILLVAEWSQRDKEYALDMNQVSSPLLRWGIYCMIFMIIIAVSYTHLMLNDSFRYSLTVNARRLIASRYEQSFVCQCLYNFYDEIL